MAKNHTSENTAVASKRSIRHYPDLMTVKDVQEILNIGRSTAYKLLQSGALNSIRIGSIYRVPKVYLTAYIKGNS